MSKDSSSSRQLLGTIKFIFDKTKSRNLNATQAYDSSTSQIVLASYKGKSTINTSTNSLGGLYPTPTYDGDVNVTATQNPVVSLAPQAGRADLTKPGTGAKSLTLGWTALPTGATKQTAALQTLQRQGDTVQFAGIAIDADGIEPADPGATIKSNATKEIFTGNIIVGTGLYREWQGKYAVLKVDLLTDKAILRVYNE
jgi:hypothetical protein